MHESRGQRVSDLASVMQSCMAWRMCACAKIKSCCSREPFAMFARKQAACFRGCVSESCQANEVGNYMLSHILIGGL